MRFQAFFATVNNDASNIVRTVLEVPARVLDYTEPNDTANSANMLENFYMTADKKLSPNNMNLFMYTPASKPENVPLPLTPAADTSVGHDHNVNPFMGFGFGNDSDCSSLYSDSEGASLSVPGSPAKISDVKTVEDKDITPLNLNHGDCYIPTANDDDLLSEWYTVTDTTSTNDSDLDSGPHTLKSLVEDSTPIPDTTNSKNYTAIGDEVNQIYYAPKNHPVEPFDTTHITPTFDSTLDIDHHSPNYGTKMGPATTAPFIPESDRLQALCEAIPEAIPEVEKWLGMIAKVDNAMGSNAMIPRTLLEWIDFREQTLMAQIAKLEGQIENEKVNAKMNITPAFGGKQFKYAGSSVLAQPTIWSDRANPAAVTGGSKRQGAANWPTKTESIWEGDDRAATGYGRFPPLVRDRSKRNRNTHWSKLPLVPMYEFDAVRKIPTCEDVMERIPGLGMY